MEELIGTTLVNVQIGDITIHNHMAVAPLTFATQHGLAYLRLSQGFEKNLLAVQEISDGGSVPELRVVNKGDQYVLLLDGEEISGGMTRFSHRRNFKCSK